ncbi:Hsp20/alpha crystallin family protein [bacterium]|nr:heat-shock protein [Planctomyces sp.]MBR9802986.1 Hsp20/alpha crystallin family protein [bacterium]
MAPSGQPGQRLLFTPVIDIYNTEDGLVLRADLPGVCVERLDLQIEDNKLTLFGRVAENLPEGARPLHREYQVGDFYRSFILSDEVAYDRIAAKMNAGVLEITLPIIPRAQPRKIHVQTE